MNLYFKLKTCFSVGPGLEEGVGGTLENKKVLLSLRVCGLDYRDEYITYGLLVRRFTGGCTCSG